MLCLGAFATNGSDGNAELKASATKATVGENVNLTVTVSGITNGEGIGAKDGACNYSITIPSGLTTVVESPNDTSKNLSGDGGNGTYDHGTYTSSTAGKYSFKLNVTKGTAGNTSTDVTFCPQAPTALPATDITSKGFTANWESVDGATYKVYVYKDGAEVSNYDEITGTSLVISDLQPSTDYTYSVFSVQNGVMSINGSPELDVTTLTPAITLTAGSNAETVLGSEANGVFRVSAENLYDSDVKLALSGENAGLFSLSSTSVTE